ncbi:MAG: Cof-type HAD-IIB family hydrolase [Firmicutes bacterium]|nr:Cof-type HAD-IIB family hydrolase [Bacillota bacterium]
MSYRVLVADIDGTLVTTAREIAAPVREAVRTVQARGVRVLLATGRIWRSARRFVEDLGADPPAILANGALVYDFAADRIWFRARLPLAHARAVLEILARVPQVQPHVYVDDRVYVAAVNALTVAYQQKDGLDVDAVGDLRQWLQTDPMKILVIGERAALTAVAREIDALPVPVNYVFSERHYLEVLPPGVNKGTALQIVAERLGVRAEEIVAVGDNLNDLAMIQYAGLGVAMAHAPEALRREADYVAPGNDEHGLRDVIERFILASKAVG